MRFARSAIPVFCILTAFAACTSPDATPDADARVDASAMDVVRADGASPADTIAPDESSAMLDAQTPDTARLDAETDTAASDAGVTVDPLGTTAPGARRRVLVVGADGLRPDAIPASMTPNLTRLARLGVVTFTASTHLTGDTMSGPGWTSILTGVGPDKHRVTFNGGYTGRDRAWPSFLWRARNNLGLRTVATGHWPDVINSILESDAVESRTTGTDEAVTTQMVSWLTAGNYDIHFIHLDDIDHAGHLSGFSPTNPAYRAALEGVDRNLGRMLDAIAASPTLATEQWMVVFVTDHGGLGTSHGARIPECRTVPLYIATPGIERFGLPTGFISHMDVHPTVMTFLGLRPTATSNLDGRPLGVRYETACGDAIDDDGDGRTDCADEDCAAIRECACRRADAGSRVGRRIFSGATTTGTGLLTGSCGGAASPEAGVTWTAPAAGTYAFDTTGSDRNFDTVLYVLDGSCAGSEIACNDDASGAQSAVRVTLAAGQRVVVVIDGKGGMSGAFQLNVEAVAACPDADLASREGARVAMGTVGETGATFFASCARSGRDVLFRWTAPRAATWRFDTAGSDYDTVLHVRDGSCTGPELGCSDDANGGYQSSLDLTLRSGQVVTVVLSGFNGRPEAPGPLPAGGSGAYTLNINAR